MAIVTVKKLIEMLSKMDPDAVVCTDSGPNTTRLTGDFKQVDECAIFESQDFENYEDGGTVKEEDGHSYRNVCVIADVDYNDDELKD